MVDVLEIGVDGQENVMRVEKFDVSAAKLPYARRRLRFSGPFFPPEETKEGYDHGAASRGLCSKVVCASL